MTKEKKKKEKNKVTEQTQLFGLEGFLNEFPSR